MNVEDLLKITHVPDQTEILIWRHTLDNLPTDKYTVLELDDNDRMVYNGRFYHLLKEKYNIDSKYWIPNLCANNLSNPLEFVNMSEIKIVDSEYLDSLMDRWENIRDKLI